MLTWVLLLSVGTSDPVASFRKTVGDALAVKHPVHVVWKGQAFGVTGTLEDELSASRWREHLTLPEIPFEDTTVVENGGGNELDTNGRAKALAGTALDVQLSAHALLSGRWLSEGELSPLPNDEQGRARVRWVPKTGAAAELTFSPDGQLAGFDIEHAGGKDGFVFSDWKLQSGVWLPQTMKRTSPTVQEAQAWRLERAEPFKDTPFSQLTSRVDFRLPPGQQSVTLPLSLLHDRWILLPLTIGGVHTTFLLDTGASVTVLNLSLAKKLGLPLKGTLTMAAGVFSGIYFVRAPALDVAGAQVDPQTVIALDLDHGEFGAMLPGIGGIAGFDFLSRFVTVIDYPASRLTFAPAEGFKPDEDDVSIPVELDGETLRVPVKVNGVEAKFMLDTGNGSGIGVHHVPGQQAWVTPAEKKSWYDPTGERFGSGVAGSWRGYASFALGPFQWLRAPVSIVDEPSAKGGSLSAQGNVGVGFLKKFRVSVDMATPRLWLAQRVPFRDRPGVTSFGFFCTRKGDDVIIATMDSGGPAAKAGLKVGQVVKTVNGMDAARSLPYLMQLMSDPLVGEKLAVGVERDGTVKTVSLKAELVP